MGLKTATDPNAFGHGASSMMLGVFPYPDGTDHDTQLQVEHKYAGIMHPGSDDPILSIASVAVLDSIFMRPSFLQCKHNQLSAEQRAALITSTDPIAVRQQFCKLLEFVESTAKTRACGRASRQALSRHAASATDHEDGDALSYYGVSTTSAPTVAVGSARAAPIMKLAGNRGLPLALKGELLLLLGDNLSAKNLSSRVGVRYRQMVIELTERGLSDPAKSISGWLSRKRAERKEEVAKISASVVVAAQSAQPARAVVTTGAEPTQATIVQVSATATVPLGATSSSYEATEEEVVECRTNKLVSRTMVVVCSNPLSFV